MNNHTSTENTEELDNLFDFSKYPTKEMKRTIRTYRICGWDKEDKQ